jgi:hypothetical protein
MPTDRAFVSTVKYHGIEEDHKLSSLMLATSLKIYISLPILALSAGLAQAYQ